MTEIKTPLEFLRWFRPGGPWQVHSIVPDGKITTRTFTKAEGRALKEWVARRIGKENLYFTTNPVRAKSNPEKKPAKKDIEALEWLHVDADAMPGEAMEKTLERTLRTLRKHKPPPSLIIMSGGGHQGFWRLDEPIPVSVDWPVQKLEAYNIQLQHLLACDSCYDICRIMRLPFTINLPAKPKRDRGREAVPATVVDRTDTSHPISAFSPATEAHTAPSAQALEPLPQKLPSVDVDALDISDDMRATIRNALPPGEDRSARLWKFLTGVIRGGKVDKATCVSISLDPAYAVSAHLLSLEKHKRRPEAERQYEKAVVGVQHGFIYNKNGEIKTNALHNVRLALIKMRVDLAFDQLAQRVLVNGKSIEEDADVLDLRITIGDDFGFMPTEPFFLAVVGETARRNAFHPIRDYLAKLEWDGTPRIDTWLHKYMGATDNEYTRAVGRLWLVAAVRRTRCPGVKFDEMLIFEGKQGSEKSTALKVLAGGDEWFLDSLPLGADAKVFIEQCTGKWIVEFAELTGMNQKEVETIKATLSRQVDRSRLAYGRITVERPRGCVFAGSTNSTKYLRDTTGARRFWPVLTEIIKLDDLSRDRDQLWAEAAAAEAAGESIRLDEKLWAEAAAEQEKRREIDPWEEILEPVVGAFKNINVKIDTRHIWACLEIDKGRRAKGAGTRLNGIMARLGYEHKKADIWGKKVWAYVKDGGVGITLVVGKLDPRKAPGEWRVSTEAEEPAKGDEIPF